MGKRIGSVTREYIEDQATPVYTQGRYAVIPHKEVIDSTYKLLAAANLEIESEFYSCTQNAEVARGIYHIKGAADPELRLIFAWVNSYDKSKRFSCASGAIIKDSGYWLSGDMGSWKRKHTGDAKKEAMETIDHQITNAGVYYNALISNKAEMKVIKLEKKARAELLGRILFLERLLTMEQAGIVKSMLMKPDGDDSLWELNVYLALAMKKSHPRDWMEKSIQLSGFINKEFKIGQPVVVTDPKQTNLLDAIAEAESQTPPESEISFEL